MTTTSSFRSTSLTATSAALPSTSVALISFSFVAYDELRCFTAPLRQGIPWSAHWSGDGDPRPHPRPEGLTCAIYMSMLDKVRTSARDRRPAMRSVQHPRRQDAGQGADVTPTDR